MFWKRRIYNFIDLEISYDDIFDFFKNKIKNSDYTLKIYTFSKK